MMAVLAPTESGASRRASEQTIRRWHSPYGWIDLVKDFPSALERSSNAVPEVFKIRQNLHYRFGKTGSNAREYRQAHLPLLMHPDPQDVLFLGLGTGLTAAGAIPHPEVRKITAVELIPEVIEAAGALAKYNFGVVDHEKTTIVSDDGRHFLLAPNEQFDVIVSDLFVPWESESGYLYTVEHYEVAATRLKEGGLFCQWLPLYQVGEFEFESIANSFSKVFPSVTLWWGKLSGSRGPVIALVGKQCPIQIDSEATNQRIERLGLSMGVDPSIANLGLVMEHFLGQWNSARSRSAVTLNRDEFPVVEFSTPISNRDVRFDRSHRRRASS
jgi:spermidine synthase